jgi:sulfur relay (sulfurtransferase) DsrF/TusC family protein
MPDDLWCFNSTFNNISAISWQSVLLVEETVVPVENYQPATQLQHRNLLDIYKYSWDLNLLG